jgi:hemoglobin
MTRKIVPLLAASLLSIALANSATAATTDQSSAATTTAVAASASAAQTKPKGDKALCDRLGGVFGIAAVVNRFSDEILTNPALLQNPALVAWNRDEAPTRLPGLKVLRTMWLADKAGCGVKFTGLPLEQAHDRLNLTAAEFAAVGGEIVEALQFFGVAQADIDRLVAIYQSSMDDVVSSTPGAKEVTPR